MILSVYTCPDCNKQWQQCSNIPYDDECSDCGLMVAPCNIHSMEREQPETEARKLKTAVNRHDLDSLLSIAARRTYRNLLSLAGTFTSEEKADLEEMLWGLG